MAVSAKFIADFESFYTAVEKATVELKSIESGASKVETSLNRMADSFSGRKIIQDANLAAKAIGDISNVTQLTANEQERLNKIVSEGIAKYQALGLEAPKSLVDLEQATRKTSGVFEDLSTQVKATALGFLSAQAIIGGVRTAFQGLTDFVGESIDSYSKAEAAAKKMTVALQQQGTATPSTIAAFNELATQFQRTTVYSDDLINEMEALLTQVGNVAPSQMGKALDAATNLASGLGIDLNNATMLVAKAFAGGGDELGRLKAILGDSLKPGADMADVLDTINRKFGGQAQAEAETYAGKIKQIANEWDNLKEAVGKSIVTDPQLAAFLKAIQDNITGIGESADRYQPTITDWWARLSGGTIPGILVGYLNSIDKDIADIAVAVSKLPAPPKEFTGFAADMAKTMADLKRESDETFKKTVEGWMAADKAAQKYADDLEAAFRKFSGADAARQMSILDNTFRRLADSGQITRQQLDDIVEEAIKLQNAGATLTPRLLAVALATGELGTKVSDGAIAFDKFSEAVRLTIPVEAQIQEQINGLTNKMKSLADVMSGYGFASVEQVQSGFEQFGKSAKKAKDELGELAQAFSQLAQIAGGSLGEIVRSIGTFISAIDTANKSMTAFRDGKKAFDAGDVLTGILGMTTGILGLASAAISAAKAIANLFDRNKGRDLVVDFAESMGGFDALHEKLLTLGAAGEELWIKLTQGVGRNNPDQARKIIQEIIDALAKQEQQTGDMSAATEEQAQATIETASEAQAALEKLGVRIKENIDEWKSWSEAVMGYIAAVAIAIRQVQMPGTSGSTGGSTTSGSGIPNTGIGGGRIPTLDPRRASSAGATYITSPIYLDGDVIATSTAKLLPQVLRQAGAVV